MSASQGPNSSATPSATPSTPSKPKTATEIAKELKDGSKEATVGIATEKGLARDLGNPNFYSMIDHAAPTSPFQKQKEAFRGALKSLNVSDDLTNDFCDRQYNSLLRDMHQEAISGNEFDLQSTAWSDKIENVFKEFRVAVANTGLASAAETHLKEQRKVVDLLTSGPRPLSAEHQALEDKYVSVEAGQKKVEAAQRQLANVVQSYQGGADKLKEYSTSLNANLDQISGKVQGFLDQQHPLQVQKAEMEQKLAALQHSGTRLEKVKIPLPYIGQPGVKGLQEGIKQIDDEIQKFKDQHQEFLKAYERFNTNPVQAVQDFKDSEKDLKTAEEKLANAQTQPDKDAANNDIKDAKARVALGPFVKSQELLGEVKGQNAELQAAHQQLHQINADLIAARLDESVKFDPDRVAGMIHRELNQTLRAGEKAVNQGSLGAMVDEVQNRLKTQLNRFNAKYPEYKIGDVTNLTGTDLLDKAAEVAKVASVQEIQHSANLFKLGTDVQGQGQAITAREITISKEALVDQLNTMQGMAMRQVEREQNGVLQSDYGAVKNAQDAVNLALNGVVDNNGAVVTPGQLTLQKELQEGIKKIQTLLETEVTAAAAVPADPSKKETLDKQIQGIKDLKGVPTADTASVDLSKLNQKLAAEKSELTSKVALDQVNFINEQVKRDKELMFTMQARQAMGFVDSSNLEYRAVDANLKNLSSGQMKALEVTGLSGQGVPQYQTGWNYTPQGRDCGFKIAFLQEKGKDRDGKEIINYSASAVREYGPIPFVGDPRKEKGFKKIARETQNFLLNAGINKINLIPKNIDKFKGNKEGEGWGKYAREQTDDQKDLFKYIGWKMDVALERQVDLFRTSQLPSEADRKKKFKDSYILVREEAKSIEIKKIGVVDKYKLYYVDENGKATEHKGNPAELNELIADVNVSKNISIASDKQTLGCPRVERVLMEFDQQQQFFGACGKDPGFPREVNPKLTVSIPDHQEAFAQLERQGKLTGDQVKKLNERLNNFMEPKRTEKKVLGEGVKEQGTVPTQMPGKVSGDKDKSAGIGAVERNKIANKPTTTEIELNVGSPEGKGAELTVNIPGSAPKAALSSSLLGEVKLDAQTVGNIVGLIASNSGSKNANTSWKETTKGTYFVTDSNTPVQSVVAKEVCDEFAKKTGIDQKFVFASQPQLNNPSAARDSNPENLRVYISKELFNDTGRMNKIKDAISQVLTQAQRSGDAAKINKCNVILQVIAPTAPVAEAKEAKDEVTIDFLKGQVVAFNDLSKSYEFGGGDGADAESKKKEVQEHAEKIEMNAEILMKKEDGNMDNVNALEEVKNNAKNAVKALKESKYGDLHKQAVATSGESMLENINKIDQHTSKQGKGM